MAPTLLVPPLRAHGAKLRRMGVSGSDEHVGWPAQAGRRTEHTDSAPAGTARDAGRRRAREATRRGPDYWARRRRGRLSQSHPDVQRFSLLPLQASQRSACTAVRVVRPHVPAGRPADPTVVAGAGAYARTRGGWPSAESAGTGRESTGVGVVLRRI